MHTSGANVCDKWRMSTHTEEPMVCTIDEAARLLSIGRTKMYELIDDGAIETVHIGRRRLVVRESLNAYLEQLRVR